MKKIQSTCNLCALACNLDFYVENLDEYKSVFRKIAQKYNLDRYTNPKYEFNG